MESHTIYANGDDYHAVELKAVKPGDFFVRKPGAKSVYIKGSYDRASKRFSAIAADDHCKELFIKGSALVYVGFTY